jgi:hypothetical protein
MVVQLRRVASLKLRLQRGLVLLRAESLLKERF